MKKIINAPETYVTICSRASMRPMAIRVKYAEGDLRCYCTANKKPGKVAIIMAAAPVTCPCSGLCGRRSDLGCGVGVCSSLRPRADP